MHYVLEEVFVQKSVRPDRVEQGLTVDEDAVIAPGNFTINVLELRHAAIRQAVKIARLDEVLISLVPGARVCQKAAQAIMRLGKPRLRFQKRPVKSNGLRRARFLHAARCQEFASKRLGAALGVSAGRNDRLGSQPASLPGGTTKTASVPMRSQ